MKQDFLRGNRDRDRAVESALRRELDKGTTAPAPDDCLDAETLAAWTSGGLLATDAATAERHVADCARCQALMATFARITPPDPVAEPLWRRWHLRWLVPLATAATAVAFWVAVPGEQMRPQTTEVVEDRLATRESAPPPAAEPAAPPPSPPARTGERQQANDLRSAPTAGLEKKQLEQELRLAQRRDADSRERNVVAEKPAAAADLVPSAPEASPDPVAPAPKTVREEAAVPRPAPPAAGAAAAVPAAPPAAAAAADSLERDRLPQRAPAAIARQAFAGGDILSPDPARRWRIVAARVVERSTDGGATWTRAEIAPPNDLTAGSSPSANVAWLVGRGGAVFVATDGARFVRLPFVNTLDLVSVTATSDQAATVVAADGRAFRTTNRGSDWTELR